LTARWPGITPRVHIWEALVRVASAAGWAIMPVDCPACLPAQEMSDDPPGELRVGAVVVTGEAPYEPTAGMTAASKNGIRRGSVTEDRPELGPPVGRLKTALMTTT
jgi:hypothetical protein